MLRAQWNVRIAVTENQLIGYLAILSAIRTMSCCRCRLLCSHASQLHILSQRHFLPMFGRIFQHSLIAIKWGKECSIWAQRNK